MAVSTLIRSYACFDVGMRVSKIAQCMKTCNWRAAPNITRACTTKWAARSRSSTEIIHHCYPTLADYIDHMNRYSSLGAEMAAAKGRRGFSLFNIVLRPAATFIYNYFFRLGFLDGREGLLLHLYHAVYVSWKYAKAWELARKKELT